MTLNVVQLPNKVTSLIDDVTLTALGERARSPAMGASRRRPEVLALAEA